MASPKEEAIALLRESNIAAPVVDIITASSENTPLNSAGHFDQEALEGKVKGGKFTVRSRRIRNLTVNWKEALYKIGTQTGGVEITPAPEHHPWIARALELLNAIRVLDGAMEIELGPKSAMIVEELWIARSGVEAVPEPELASAMHGRIPNEEMPELLGSLRALGIINLKDGEVIKTESFTLVA